MSGTLVTYMVCLVMFRYELYDEMHQNCIKLQTEEIM